MSLTSFIKNKEVKKLFLDEFKKPKGKIIGEIKAPPITNHYSMIGTAFDYLMRFYLKYYNPKAKEYRWIAENLYKLTETDPAFSTIHEKALHNLEFAKNSYLEFLTKGIINDEILKSTILLAQLDPIFRAGYIAENIGNVYKEDIQDLRNLISLVNIEDFKVNSHCLLNPTFNEGSLLVGGADCDIVIDNQMIDIKTTKKLDISRDMFNQVIGYYILGAIGGVGINNGTDKIDISNINEIGFYFSRYGLKYMYKIEEIINLNSLPDFIDKFEGKAKEFMSLDEKIYYEVYKTLMNSQK